MALIHDLEEFISPFLPRVIPANANVVDKGDVMEWMSRHALRAHFSSLARERTYGQALSFLQYTSMSEKPVMPLSDRDVVFPELKTGAATKGTKNPNPKRRGKNPKLTLLGFSEQHAAWQKGKVPKQLSYEFVYDVLWAGGILQVAAINRPRLSTSTSADSLVITKKDENTRNAFLLQIQDKNVVSFTPKEACDEALKAFRIVSTLRDKG